MAIISFVDRHDNIRDEAKLAWSWVKKLPEYKADYKKQKKFEATISVTDQDQLRKKYGFYPLINPKIKMPYDNAPFEFFVAFGKLLQRHPFDSGIDFKNLDYVDLHAHQNPTHYKKYKFRGRDLPKRIVLELDPKKPTNFILEQVRRYLKEVKKVYGIKETRARSHKMHLTYKAYVLSGLNVQGRKIKKILEPLIDDAELGESRVKRAERVLALAKRAGTDKS